VILEIFKNRGLVCGKIKKKKQRWLIALRKSRGGGGFQAARLLFCHCYLVFKLFSLLLAHLLQKLREVCGLEVCSFDAMWFHLYCYSWVSYVV